MARHKDTEWYLPEGKPSASGRTEHSWDSIHAALLMDIRDELKRLNSLLWCQNFVAIPQTLRRIARNTSKSRRKK